MLTEGVTVAGAEDTDCVCDGVTDIGAVVACGIAEGIPVETV